MGGLVHITDISVSADAVVNSPLVLQNGDLVAFNWEIYVGPSPFGFVPGQVTRAVSQGLIPLPALRQPCFSSPSRTCGPRSPLRDFSGIYPKQGQCGQDGDDQHHDASESWTALSINNETPPTPAFAPTSYALALVLLLSVVHARLLVAVFPLWVMVISVWILVQGRHKGWRRNRFRSAVPLGNGQQRLL